MIQLGHLLFQGFLSSKASLSCLPHRSGAICMIVVRGVLPLRLCSVQFAPKNLILPIFPLYLVRVVFDFAFSVIIELRQMMGVALDVGKLIILILP
jgi:hypothetical protein